MLLQKVAEDDCDEVDFEDSEAVLFHIACCFHLCWSTDMT